MNFTCCAHMVSFLKSGHNYRPFTIIFMCTCGMYTVCTCAYISMYRFYYTEIEAHYIDMYIFMINIVNVCP